MTQATSGDRPCRRLAYPKTIIDRTVRSMYFNSADHSPSAPSGVLLSRLRDRKLLKEPKSMVATNPTTIRIVSDEDSSKRRQILDGARKVFMDLGFDGASMGEIARAAAVSKG